MNWFRKILIFFIKNVRNPLSKIREEIYHPINNDEFVVPNEIDLPTSNRDSELVSEFEKKIYDFNGKPIMILFYDIDKLYLFEDECHNNKYFYVEEDKKRANCIYLKTNIYSFVLELHNSSDFFRCKRVDKVHNKEKLALFKKSVRIRSVNFEGGLSGQDMNNRTPNVKKLLLVLENEEYDTSSNFAASMSPVFYKEHLDDLLNVLDIKNEYDSLYNDCIEYIKVSRTIDTKIKGICYNFFVKQANSLFCEGMNVFIRSHEKCEDRIMGYIVNYNEPEMSFTIKVESVDFKDIPEIGLITQIESNVIYNTQKQAIDNLKKNMANNKSILDVLYKKKYMPIYIKEYKEYKGKTKSQNEAINKAVNCDDFLLVQGPPGTGKTTIIIEMIREFVAQGKKVLISSKNNLAVDNVLEKCMEKDISCMRLGREETVRVEKVKDILPDKLIVTMEENIKNRVSNLLGREDQKYYDSLKDQSDALKSMLSYYELLEKSIVDYYKANTQCNRLKFICQFIDLFVEDSYEKYFHDFEERKIELMKIYNNQVDVFQEYCNIADVPIGLIIKYMDKQLLKDRLFIVDRKIGGIASLKGIYSSWLNVLNQRDESLEQILLENIQVYGATCIGVNTSQLFKNINYDVAIIDESGQIPIFDALVPISKAKKVILVGDHKQLPPGGEQDFYQYVEEVDNSLNVKDLFEVSLFEKLYYQTPDDHKVMLDTQYRMHQDIAEYISYLFYEGKYYTGCLDEHREFNLANYKEPVMFIDTNNLKNHYENIRNDVETNQKLYSNQCEANIIAKIICDMMMDLPITIEDYNGKRKLTLKDIGIITPYKEQIRVINETMRMMLHEKSNYQSSEIEDIMKQLDIATVDSFQGRDKEIIFYSFTRSNTKHRIGFLNELRRLNVSITRAKRSIFMVGDSDTLVNTKALSTVNNDKPCNYYFSELIKYCKNKNYYYQWSEKDYEKDN